MKLYRFCYLKNGRLHGITAATASAQEATQFGDIWERMTGWPVLTIKPLRTNQ